jgi:hypothetical protein
VNLTFKKNLPKEKRMSTMGFFWGGSIVLFCFVCFILAIRTTELPFPEMEIPLDGRIAGWVGNGLRYLLDNQQKMNVVSEVLDTESNLISSICRRCLTVFKATVPWV